MAFTNRVSNPSPAWDLPMLPGKLIESVTSSTPLVVGEFSGAKGEKYAMVVNLSLERTTQVKIKAVDGHGIQIVSAVDRVLSNYDEKLGLWLNAGQGVLLKVN